MKRFLLDTNICIELLRGNKAVNKKALSIGIARCFISIINMIELRIGEELAKSNPVKYRNQHIDDFLDSLEIIPIDKAVVDYFIKEKVRLQLAGTPAHNNFDLLIGCTAVVNGLTMVTDNIKDFKRISNIKLEDWLER